jgi:hypothetical protein
MGSANVPYSINLRGLGFVQDKTVSLNEPGHMKDLEKIYPCMGGIAIHRFDREGRPVVYELMGSAKSKQLVGSVGLEDILQFHIR